MIIHSYVMPGQHLPGVFSSGAAAPLVAELLILASPSAPARRKPTTPTTSDCSRGDHRAGVMGRQPERRHLQYAVKRIARDLDKTPSQHKPNTSRNTSDFGPFVTGQIRVLLGGLFALCLRSQVMGRDVEEPKSANKANSGSEDRFQSRIKALYDPPYDTPLQSRRF